MQRSEQIAELTTALAKASEEFPHIERGCTAKVNTKSGGSYSYSYADLNDVLSAVRPALAKNGLTLSHDCKVVRETVDGEDGPEYAYAVETTAILEHSSGQWKHSSPFLVPCDGSMAAAQLVGSGATYGKRYTAQNILGLSTESDDDGNAASGNDATTGKRAPKPACPQCGKSEFVFENKHAPGWYCWKNDEKKKLGCGHKWDSPLESTAPPVNPSGSATDGPAPKITTDDARYINEAQSSLRSAATEVELRALWETIKDKPGPIKTALHPVFKERLKELAA